MDQETRVNSSGDILVYHKETKCWIPIEVFPTPEKLAKSRRKLSHPKIKVISIIINCIVPIILISILSFVIRLFYMKQYNWFENWSNIFILFMILLGCYFLLRLKSFVIFLIHLYQIFAPEHIRLRCVFTPTCSEYMIISIKKYGLIRGIIKGINRLKRCHGEDREDWP